MDLPSLALRWDGTRVLILDQSRLPHEERWLEGSDPADMVGHIRSLRVRGAPLIGVAAAFSLAALARTGADAATLAAAADRLRASRPTAVNLMVAVDRMRPVFATGIDGVVAEAEAIAAEDVALCERIAEAGATLIDDGEGVLHHCNTGALATAGVGTALGILRRAWEGGKRLHVWVDETRPLLQGGRLTAWELGRLGVPHTLVTDSMAALVLRDGRARRVLVGADRIARNGDFANKVGTYGLAVLARAHGADFHCAAPSSTVDRACPDGGAIPIEERDADEVRGWGPTRWAPADAPTWNPAFDVTPASLVTSYVLDTGVIDASRVREGGI